MLPGKTSRYEKTKMYFNKASKWLKTIIVTNQNNVFVFEFALIVWWYYNVCFHTICADVVYSPRKIHSYLLIFPPIKDFLDVYNLAHPSQFKICEILTISNHFDYTFVHISKYLRVFCKLRNVPYFGK